MLSIDPDARMAEVWHPDDERPEIVTDTLHWRVSPDAPDLLIPLEDIFPSPEEVANRDSKSR